LSSIFVIRDGEGTQMGGDGRMRIIRMGAGDFVALFRLGRGKVWDERWRTICTRVGRRTRCAVEGARVHLTRTVSVTALGRCLEVIIVVKIISATGASAFW
jgi:hypothetical protein